MRNRVVFASVALILATLLIPSRSSAGLPKLKDGGKSQDVAPKKGDLPPFKKPKPPALMGMVMYFNLTSCPQGWVEVQEARGRYVVGLTPQGSRLGSQGMPLEDLEDRPVGRHTHGVDDPGHDHWYSPPVLTSTSSGSSKAGVGSPIKTSKEFTLVSLKEAGDKEGTNAPYVQLLVCRSEW